MSAVAPDRAWTSPRRGSLAHKQLRWPQIGPNEHDSCRARAPPYKATDVRAFIAPNKRKAAVGHVMTVC